MVPAHAGENIGRGLMAKILKAAKIDSESFANTSDRAPELWLTKP